MSVDAQWRTDITRQMGEMAKAQQDTTVALTRILGRLDNMERRQDDAEHDADKERERREQRRDAREDEQPEQTRATIAILVSCVSAAVYALSILAAHWKP